MNKLAMLLAVSFAIPVSVAAQDDMYFVPSESADAPVSEVAEEPAPTYYIGSQRDVDEYNRQGTYVQQIDSAGNDIIDFDGTVGVYPDSLRDYECTRQMSRLVRALLGRLQRRPLGLVVVERSVVLRLLVFAVVLFRMVSLPVALL